jgi:hypothetical protein
MAAEVLRYPNRETAWGIYGVTLNGIRVVTGVLLPSPGDVERNYATARFGGRSTAEKMQWLVDNWDFMRSLGGNPDGAEFVMFYKGHSHHHIQPLDAPCYSSTDNASILEAVADENGLVEAIGPLAVCRTTESMRALRGRSGIMYRSSQAVHFVFYFLSQEMVERGITEPILIQPVLIDDPTRVPVTPPEGWHNANEVQYQHELALLRGYGCEVVQNYREVAGGPPYEIVLSVDRPTTWRNMLTITIFSDHPATPPIFTVIPWGRRVEPSTDFDGLPELLEGPLWNKNESFIQAVYRLIARKEL